MTKTMKWFSVTMLLLAVCRLPVANHQTLLSVVVFASGLVIAAQSVRSRRYLWTVGLFAIAVLFNPVVSIARSGRDVWWLNSIGLAAFLMAALAFNGRRALTVPPITNHVANRKTCEANFIAVASNGGTDEGGTGQNSNHGFY